MATEKVVELSITPDPDAIIISTGMTGVRWPDSPDKRKFVLRAEVIDGPKSAIGRKAELELSDSELVRLYKDINDMVRRYKLA